MNDRKMSMNDCLSYKTIDFKTINQIYNLTMKS